MIDSIDIFKARLYGRKGSLTAVTDAFTIFDSALSNIFTVAGDLAGKIITMTSGSQEGKSANISSYNPGTGQLITSGFLQAPLIGDTYLINSGPPPVAVAITGATNVANAINNRIIDSNFDMRGIETDPTALTEVSGANPISFTFGISAFVSALILLPATNDQNAGINGFAQAFASGLAGATIAQNPLALSVFIPPLPVPTSIFSAITSITIDPLSITDAVDKILEFIGEGPDSDLLPEKIHDAFKVLTITVDGSDSSSPSPLPLTAVGVPLI